MVTTILFGLYTAGVAIVITLVTYFLGVDMAAAGGLLNYVPYLFLLLFLWLALRERKQDEFGGVISYGQCVSTGALVGLCAGVATAIFTFVYITRINPGLVDVILQRTSEALQARNMDPQKLHAAMSMEQKMFVPMAVIGPILAYTFFGTLFALILGIFVHSKESPDEIKAV